ncbi:MAG: 3-phosphoshikimate 1-carboxyvinyltransferase [Actinobacteria bacterium]|nr:3-phosphoshikimate 1-carboxyvinyltransferase [Actinomycetota bacterium]
MSDWQAPFRGDKPISATLTIPGSKSATNRALVLAALAQTPSTLIRPLHSRDTELMIKALKALGTEISITTSGSDATIQVNPKKLMGPASIDVGNAGTVMRFILPIAALAQGLIHFDGDARSHERPVGPLIKALTDLGVSIKHDGRFALPLTINGSGGIAGGSVAVDASKSSQFLSALLLAAPAMRNGLEVRHIGERLPSLPHIEMTLDLLATFGAQVSVADNLWKVTGSLSGKTMAIEPDLSNAAPFLAAVMVCGGEVIIKDWPIKTNQPGDRLREIFTQMGANMEFVQSGLRVKGNGVVRGIDIDLHNEGELTPVIAALAALADSPSRLTGIGHLRLHETDRLSALRNELELLGGKVTEGPDSLLIEPRTLHSGTFHTYEDHRLATAGALLGLKVSGIRVENIETTRKTLPDFVELWSTLLR